MNYRCRASPGSARLPGAALRRTTMKPCCSRARPRNAWSRPCGLIGNLPRSTWSRDHDHRQSRPRVGTASADESRQVPPPVENAPAPEASSQLMSPFLPAAPALATAAEHSGQAARGCPALRVTAGHHDADPFPGRHHPWQRQRHCACGAYLTVTRRRETGRRDRKRLRVTLRPPGLQGENPGKKERS